MKRFTKMLALGMAMALTFGMTVSASGSDPVAPSPSTKVEISTPEGIEVSNLSNPAEVEAACVKAVEQDGVLSGYFGSKMETFYWIDMFDLDVKKAGKVTFDLGTAYSRGSSADYGNGWGYALLHFKGGNLNAKPEVIRLNKDGNAYSANVTSGSPYVIISWARTLHTYDSIGVGRRTYQDQHTAARAAIETGEIGKRLGDTIIQEYMTKDYKFEKTMGSAILNLAEDSVVEFSVPDIDGDCEYVVLCYNDMWKKDPWGYPDRHFRLQRTAENTYSAELPKGEYLVVVIKGKNMPGSAPAPTTPVDTTVTAPTLQGGAQAPAAGVVSPKTGEALPMAVILAAICLAGAAVCAKKARCNG